MLDRLIDSALYLLQKYSFTVARRTAISRSCDIGGQRLRIPVVAGAGADNLRPDPYYLVFKEVIAHLLARRDGAIVDVGCNVGQFALACVLADRRRRYAGFDISLSCCHYMERFIGDNRLDGYQVFPLGLADRAGIQRFVTNGPFDVCASLSAAAYEAGRFATSRTVLTERGDDVLARLGLEQLALLKIDVEGAEPQVLEGLAQTLARQRPCLLFEVLCYAHLAAAPGEAEDLHAVARHRRAIALALDRLLLAHDYLVYRLQPDGALHRLQSVDPAAVLDATTCDNLALPREQAEQILAGYPFPVLAAPTQAAA